MTGVEQLVFNQQRSAHPTQVDKNVEFVAHRQPLLHAPGVSDHA